MAEGIAEVLQRISLLLPGKFAEKVPPELRLPVEMKWMILTVALTRFAILCLSIIAEKMGIDKARETVNKGFTDLLNLLTGGDPKVLKDLFGIEGNDTTAAAKLIVALDDILGNIEVITETKPERTVCRNIDCRIWENRKDMKLEEKFPCVIFCFESIKAVSKFLNPKIDFRGEKNSEVLGIPGKSFNKCRIVGDDCCEVEYFLK
jgi:hypothetical protein